MVSAPRPVTQERLLRSGLVKPRFKSADEAVRWFGAVQAQDYAGAKWGIGQRTKGLDDAAFDRAFNSGAILRTHVLRPTWHFVMPEDIRWMLKLTGPRVKAATASRHRQLGIEPADIRKGHRAVERALTGGGRLTRHELREVYSRVGVDPTEQRLVHLLYTAELDGLICSGGLRGKQQTWALLEEVVPVAPAFDHDSSLAELVRRYFQSHGPATLNDFSWWSGLTMAQIRAGVELATADVRAERHGGIDYWTATFGPPRESPRSTSLRLLPNYDEYLIAYRGYGQAISGVLNKASGSFDPLRAHLVLVDGEIVGGWQRRLEPKRTVIVLDLRVELTSAISAALDAEVERYSAFLDMPVVVRIL